MEEGERAWTVRKITGMDSSDGSRRHESATERPSIACSDTICLQSVVGPWFTPEIGTMRKTWSSGL
jgi:hypothetical protein